MIQTLGKSRNSWDNLYFLKSLQMKTWQESPVDTILKTAGRLKGYSQDPRIVRLTICSYFIAFIISILYVSTETLLLVLNVLEAWFTIFFFFNGHWHENLHWKTDGLNTHPALELLSSAGSQEHFPWKRFAELGWWRFRLYILARSLKYIKQYIELPKGNRGLQC